MFVISLQDQVPGELFPAAGQPRVRQHKQDLRVPRRVLVLIEILYLKNKSINFTLKKI